MRHDSIFPCFLCFLCEIKMFSGTATHPHRCVHDALAQHVDEEDKTTALIQGTGSDGMRMIFNINHVVNEKCAWKDEKFGEKVVPLHPNLSNRQIVN